MPDTNLTDAPRGAVVSPSSVSDLPNVAPCSTLSRRAPLKWIRLGARDIRQALFPSLSYGLLLTLCGYFVVYVAFTFGNVFSVMALASGFILLGPMVAMTFYEISRQLQEGAKPGLLHSLRCSLAHVGEQMVFALILLVIFLIWARAASMIHVFLPINSQASHAEFALFLGIGTGVGSLFAVLVLVLELEPVLAQVKALAHHRHLKVHFLQLELKIKISLYLQLKVQGYLMDSLL